MIRINKNTSTPLYIQLMHLIIENINTGVYEVGTKLPTERDLSELYNVSRITVRQSLKELENQNYIVKQHGKGNFVLERKEKQNLLDTFSFSEEMKKKGKEPVTKVENFTVMTAPKHIIKKLKLNKNDKIIRIIRHRFADKQPMMYEISYLPYDYFYSLTVEKLEKYSMYEVFEKEYNLDVTNVVEEFSVTLTREDEAEFLKIATGSPAIFIERKAYSETKLVEYTVTIVSSNHFYFKLERKK